MPGFIPVSLSRRPQGPPVSTPCVLLLLLPALLCASPPGDPPLTPFFGLLCPCFSWNPRHSPFRRLVSSRYLNYFLPETTWFAFLLHSLHSTFSIALFFGCQSKIAQCFSSASDTPLLPVLFYYPRITSSPPGMLHTLLIYLLSALVSSSRK